MIVVDASLVVEALTVPRSPAGDALQGADGATSPAHIDAEIGHALRGLVRGGLLDPAEAQECLGDVAASGIIRFPLTALLHRAFDLRENMTFYDALYVALAELHDLTLVTTDSKFARVPSLRCAVEVVPTK